MMLNLLAVDFGLQFVMFLVSVTLGTDHLYDLTGTSTFVILSLLSYFGGLQASPRQTLLTAMVCTWGVRLGSFLVVRIFWYGSDPRLQKILPKPQKFLLYWMIQGVWVIVTSLPVHLVNGSQDSQAELGIVDFLGFALWLFGFLYESVADYHKFYYRLTHQNQKDFVRTGLWRFSRHPNYFGEIVLWWGVFLVAFSGLSGLGLLCVASPVFVAFLLIRVSGVPLLEKQYESKYSTLPAYQAYKTQTPVLIPNFFR